MSVKSLCAEAISTGTSLERLLELARHKDPAVRRSVCRNPNVPTKELIQIYEIDHMREATCAEIVRHMNVPLQLVIEIVHQHPGLGALVVQQPYFPIVRLGDPAFLDKLGSAGVSKILRSCSSPQVLDLLDLQLSRQGYVPFGWGDNPQITDDDLKARWSSFSLEMQLDLAKYRGVFWPLVRLTLEGRMATSPPTFQEIRAIVATAMHPLFDYLVQEPSGIYLSDLIWHMKALSRDQLDRLVASTLRQYLKTVPRTREIEQNMSNIIYGLSTHPHAHHDHLKLIEPVKMTVASRYLVQENVERRTQSRLGSHE